MPRDRPHQHIVILGRAGPSGRVTRCSIGSLSAQYLTLKRVTGKEGKRRDWKGMEGTGWDWTGRDGSGSDRRGGWAAKGGEVVLESMLALMLEFMLELNCETQFVSGHASPGSICRGC